MQHSKLLNKKVEYKLLTKRWNINYLQKSGIYIIFFIYIYNVNLTLEGPALGLGEWFTHVGHALPPQAGRTHQGMICGTQQSVPPPLFSMQLPAPSLLGIIEEQLEVVVSLGQGPILLGDVISVHVSETVRHLS